MTRARAVAVLAALVALPAMLAGCGSNGAASLRVSAAASLKRAFTGYGANVGDTRVRLEFAGSDELAARIRQGVKPDVFAAANTKLPDQLYKANLLGRPTVFASNRLVLAVPSGSTKVRSLADLERPGVTIAVGSPSVPVGAYTRQVLARLGAARAARVLVNVRSNEPDVAGVVGKLSQGAVDAGFIYATDVRAATGKLSAIPIPDGLRPTVAYAAAVVRGDSNPRAARAFIRGLLSGPGRVALARSGFSPPPQ